MYSLHRDKPCFTTEEWFRFRALQPVACFPQRAVCNTNSRDGQCQQRQFQQREGVKTAIFTATHVLHKRFFHNSQLRQRFISTTDFFLQRTNNFSRAPTFPQAAVPPDEDCPDFRAPHGDVANPRCKACLPGSPWGYNGVYNGWDIMEYNGCNITSSPSRHYYHVITTTSPLPRQRCHHHHGIHKPRHQHHQVINTTTSSTPPRHHHTTSPPHHVTTTPRSSPHHVIATAFVAIADFVNKCNGTFVFAFSARPLAPR